MACLLDDLRGHPVGGPLDGLEPRVHGDEVLDLLRGAEIRELHDARVVHQDVGALDVAVHDLVRVEELEPQEDLLRVDAQDALCEAPELRQQRSDGAPRDVLEEDVEGRHVAGDSLRPEVPHDVGVVQLLEDVDFGLEAVHVRCDLSLEGLVPRDGDLLHGHELP